MRRFLFAILILAACAAKGATPLALHPENPDYFLFRGKPEVIITSGEHYGAVLNLDFDYNQYLAELEARQLNGTRTFSGVYFEPQGAFNIAENTLAPANGRYIGPWPRTGVRGATHGGTKFDLTKWNDNYFARLRDFLRQASARGIIVEMNLFCPFYEEAQWKLSPLNASNNVNGLGNIERTNVYTMDKHGGLLPIEEALVKKMVLELNQFDNLYFEICNEPYFGGVTVDWQRHIADVITEAERVLPNKHLISQNIANGSAGVVNPHTNVSILNFHYAAPPDAISINYGLNRVIGDNETGFRGTNDLAYRREAWDFILAGGALFNNLDYSFTTRAPRGTFVNYPAKQPGGGNPVYREELRILRNFIHRFDFLHMEPTTNLIKSGVPPGATARVLAQDRNFAVYLGPTPPVAADKYSVRWTGKLRAPRTGEYTFYTVSNDGVRLWLNGQLLIDNWTAHSQAEDKGTISLRAGKNYDLKLEYFQAGGNAMLQLSWKPPGLPRSIVTPDRFLTARNQPGLDAEYFTGQNFDLSSFRRVDPLIDFDWSAKSPFDPATNPAMAKLARLELNLPAGEYVAHWINTLNGQIERPLRFTHRGGSAILSSPPYLEDIALEIHPYISSGKRILDISP
jgi:hypothetical protein